MNPLSNALAFTHLYGNPKVLLPANDRALKYKLVLGFGKTSDLPFSALSDAIDKETFTKLSGDEGKISTEKLAQLVAQKTPKQRELLIPKIKQYADLLSTQFELIEEGHLDGAEQLVAWIVKNYEAGKPLGITIICTGNSRRSMLGATMGNIAATYHGLTNIRFGSGGTEPSAFNPRSIATLKEIGVEIEATGKEAERGKTGDRNPIYKVTWGKGLETAEFSKKYNDPQNAQKDFAAVLVCNEADEACPSVKGASVRIPVMYFDPKAFDNAPFESAKYAERRDDVGRFMLSVMMQARRRLEIEGKLK